MIEPTPSPASEPDEDDEDRRTALRCGCRMLASCEATAGGATELYPGTIQNLSETGMGVVLSHRFSPGDVLKVTMRLLSGGVLDKLQVRVMWARPHDGNLWLHGCHVIH